MEELIIQYLLSGKTQFEISQIFKEKNIQPNSLSLIEKTVKKIKSLVSGKN